MKQIDICCFTYPVHLHVLKLKAKVITLYQVASKENLRQEGLSKSFRLKEKTKTMSCCISKTKKTSTLHMQNLLGHQPILEETLKKEKLNFSSIYLIADYLLLVLLHVDKRSRYQILDTCPMPNDTGQLCDQLICLFLIC